MNDGSTIRVSRQSTADGGWIAIHDDITEREQLNARLAEQNVLLQQHEAELRAQNANLDIALPTCRTASPCSMPRSAWSSPTTAMPKSTG